jgi:hypothetical protein
MQNGELGRYSVGSLGASQIGLSNFAPRLIVDTTAKWLRSDSALGTGGNIAIAAEKLVKVTGTQNVDGVDFSIFAGTNGNPKINIVHSITRDPDVEEFTVGDATINGTAGSIMGGLDVITDTLLLDIPFTVGNILINTSIPVGNNPYLEAIVSDIVLSTFYREKSILLQQFQNNIGNSIKDFVDESRRLQAAFALTKTAALDDPQYGSEEVKKLIARSVLPDIYKILKAAAKYGVTDRAQIAYILATTSHESQFGTIGAFPGSSTHNPMYEYSGGAIGDEKDF